MFKEKLKNNLQKQLNLDLQLEIPLKPEFGDFALHCYKLKSSPKEIQEKLTLPDYLEKTEIKGPYLNFFVKTEHLAKFVIETVQKEKETYASNLSGKNKKALIEHTSINPNASPHLGRARNAIVGDSITRLLKFEGYKTEVHYYVNDIGKQIAMLVLAAEGKQPKFKELLQLYVDFNKKLESDKNLEKKVFNLLDKLEKGDKTTLKKFQEITDICVQGQANLLQKLGIDYDFFDHESKYIKEDQITFLLTKLEKTNKTFKDEEGRICIDLKDYNLPMKNPILPLTRANGTSMYQLRDILYTQEKMETAHDKNIVVLGEDHKLYFQQLSTLLSLIKQKSPEPIFYSYVLLKEGKMSTRQGKVVLLEDFMDLAKKKALEEINKREIVQQNKETLAEQIAYSAAKFQFLKVSPEKNITFDLEEALSFEGDTSPYIQYTYARAQSILEKSISSPKSIDFSLFKHASEKQLFLTIDQAREKTLEAINTLRITPLASYLLILAKSFNEFYHNCPVSKAEAPLAEARLTLIKIYLQVLENIAFILGITLPKHM